MGYLSSVVNDFIYIVPAVLISIVLHEWAHGMVSYMLGDMTPKLDGRLSLNPKYHLDVIGTLSLVIFHFGWAKPVNVNAGAYDNPKTGMILTALAGPIMNFILAFISLLLVGFIQHFHLYNIMFDYIVEVLIYVSIFSVGLGIFNLIPIPPLDGSKVLFGFLPERLYFKYMQYEEIGMLVLVGILAFGGFDLIQPLAYNLINNMIAIIERFLWVL